MFKTALHASRLDSWNELMTSWVLLVLLFSLVYPFELRVIFMSGRSSDGATGRMDISSCTIVGFLVLISAPSFNGTIVRDVT